MPSRDPQQEHIRSNEWIGASFVGLGLGAAGVAGALAWVTSSIGPGSIPIWFAAIGGTAYVLRGPLGQAIAAKMGGVHAETAAELPGEVYGELDELRARVAELEERVDFSERLLTKGREAGSHEP